MTGAPIFVLLVEDDEVVRASMRFALESAQLRIREAGSVGEARQCFAESACDVVIIDLHLPDGSGHDLAQHLRQLNPHLPLVMISTDPELHGQSAPLYGPSTMLAKPFSASQLLDAISEEVAGDMGHLRD